MAPMTEEQLFTAVHRRTERSHAGSLGERETIPSRPRYRFRRMPADEPGTDERDDSPRLPVSLRKSFLGAAKRRVRRSIAANRRSHANDDDSDTDTDQGKDGVWTSTYTTTVAAVTTLPTIESSTSATATASVTMSMADDSDSNGAQKVSVLPSTAATVPTTTAEATVPAPTTATATTGTRSTADITNLISFAPAVPSLSSTVGSIIDASTCTTSTTSATAAQTTSNKKHKTTGDTDDDDETATTATTGSSSSSGSDSSSGDSSSDSYHSAKPVKLLSPGAEAALISVGSIGAFIVVCFLLWLVWRTMRRQRQRKKTHAFAAAVVVGGSPASPSAAAAMHGSSAAAASLARRLFHLVAARIPALNRRLAWQTLEAEKSRSGEDGLYHNEKSVSVHETALPTIPAQAAFGGRIMDQHQLEEPARTPTWQTAVAADGNPHATTESTLPQTQLLVSDRDEVASTISNTLRSRMPDPFYNQSQLARQPSDAYDPMRRQVNRVSELSSLSSGFGDGEILLAGERSPRLQPLAPAPPPLNAPPAAAQPPGAGHFSWMRSSKYIPGSRRETVYTEASDDQPARFRTVTSWVHQQTGRVRRAQQRSNESNDLVDASATAGTLDVRGSSIATPGIPHPMPAEQRLTMMVDDDQEPRRPDTVPSMPPPY